MRAPSRSPGLQVAIRRVAGWGWPPGFEVVQFPNPPLLVAVAASVASNGLHGHGQRVAQAIFYMGLSVWAYEEAWHGDNWFRRLLGAGFLVYLVARLARALDG
jgi:hypothetical protein